jgi:hypothetical protein
LRPTYLTAKHGPKKNVNVLKRSRYPIELNSAAPEQETQNSEGVRFASTKGNSLICKWKPSPFFTIFSQYDALLKMNKRMNGRKLRSPLHSLGKLALIAASSLIVGFAIPALTAATSGSLFRDTLIIRLGKMFPEPIKRLNDFDSTKWYVHGDPPIGVKLADDADEIDLDLSLEKYSLAKDLLAKVLKSFVNDCDNLSIPKILNEGAIDRLVLASGELARDFLAIFRRAVDFARERGEGHRGPKIGSEN